MNWISTHSQVISTLISVGTLLVWVFYAHLLYLGFRRNERPLLVIHEARGQSQGAFCIVVNLSRQPIHVVTVDLILHLADKKIDLRLNRYQRITSDDESDWAAEDVMKEGPLRSGDFLSLGGLQSMIEATSFYEQQEGEQRVRAKQLSEDVREIEIWISALSSSFIKPVGASRCFVVNQEQDELQLDPVTPITQQMNSFLARRRLYRWLQRHEKAVKQTLRS